MWRLLVFCLFWFVVGPWIVKRWKSQEPESQVSERGEGLKALAPNLRGAQIRSSDVPSSLYIRQDVQDFRSKSVLRTTCCMRFLPLSLQCSLLAGEKESFNELRWLRSARAVQRLESPESEAPLRAEEVSSERFATVASQTPNSAFQRNRARIAATTFDFLLGARRRPQRS